jgi:hypothetical protein
MFSLRRGKIDYDPIVFVYNRLAMSWRKAQAP